MKITVTIVVLFLFSFSIPQLKAQDHKYKEFDFWIGEWDVYKNGTDSIVGRSTIERIIEGKVIKETYYSTTSKYHGTSLNKYNPQIDQWEQFWVDNSGLTLHIKGNLESGKMILQNEVLTDKGLQLNKITWQKNDDNTVQQIWYQRSNKGEAWKEIFNGNYLKKEK